MFSMPLGDAVLLEDDFRRGQPEAVAAVNSLFPPTAQCFICDEITGDDVALVVVQDPVSPSNAIVGDLCVTCAGLPLLVRFNRLRKLLLGMFPQLNPRKIQLIPQTAARVLRKGSPA